MPRSLRTQLTLLYAGPFLVSVVLLLGALVSQIQVSVPVNDGGQRPPRSGPDVHQLLVASALGLGVTAVVALALGWLVAGRFLRPLRTITATARDISASNLNRRLGRTGRNDEFTRLAATLDDLFGRLEAAFDAQRHFVANAAHELRTPLTAERALLQVALADPEATVDSLRAAGRDVLALNLAQEHLIDALLTLASGERGVEAREEFDLAEIAGRVIADRVDEARHRGIRLAPDLAAAPTSGDPRLVASLVANLVDNALRHNESGGHVEIATSGTGGPARLLVTNTGPVVPPDQVGRLFQPFERLDGRRLGRTDGHGLGLAIVAAIATAHGATLDPRVRPDGGLSIAVSFPTGPAPHSRPQ